MLQITAIPIRTTAAPRIRTKRALEALLWMHAPSGHYVYMSHQGRGSHSFTHRLFVERRQNDIITVKASNGAPSSSSNCYASLFSPLIRPRQQQPGEKKKEEKNRSRYEAKCRICALVDCQQHFLLCGSQTSGNEAERNSCNAAGFSVASE